jgi:uncharacterized protein (UPF0548 family)
MATGMKFVRPAESRTIDRLAESLRDAELTYSDSGATLTGRRPIGFHNDSYRAVLGHGAATFERAVQGLQAWQAHRLPGVRVFPNGTKIESGAIVIVTLGTPMFALAAPCRIVKVIDEANRWGFAYGTLPGHPEDGEEAFVVSISAEGSVRFEITVFSRPGNSMVRLSGPIGPAIQKNGTKGYVRALRRHVDQRD